MIYIWQNTTNTNKIELAEKEAQNLKYDLEEKLSKTKNKLVGVESENADLKTVNEKLQAKTDALNVAKRGFVSEDLGFSFFYPATFGEASAEIEEGLEGKKFMGKFSDNDKFVFGGITKDYISSSSPEAVFTNTQGFRKRWDKYLFKSLESETYEVNPAKVVDIGGGEAILLDKNSFVQEDQEDNEAVPVDIGENVGFLVNLDNSEFSGIGFLNLDFSALPLAELEDLIKTLKIINK